MKKKVDCLLVGHNEMDFPQYEKSIRKMGRNSGAYSDLNLNFIYYEGKPYLLPEVYNILVYKQRHPDHLVKPLNMGDSFSAAIAYLGTYLYRRGFTFDYINCFREEKKALVEKLEQNDYIAIAITTTFYVSVLPIIEIIGFIKRYNNRAKIIIGGPYVSTKVRTQNAETLDYLFKSIGADFYINSSQGETTLVNLLKSLKNNLPVHRVSNIYYIADKGYNGTPLVREDNKLSQNMVDWQLFSWDVGEYVNVRTSISCPFTCSFCGFPQHAGLYQTVAVDLIENELKKIERIQRVKCVHFIDDTFNIPVKRFKEILRMIIENRFGFKWHSYFRCQFVDREMVELMKESCCEGVFLGLESGNNQVLNNMNKHTDIEKYRRGIQLLKEYDIVTFGDFIIGFPGETQETLQDTIAFIKSSGLDFYRTQLWYCEPITPIWQEREKYKLTGESFEWSHRTMDAKTACHHIEEIFLTIEEPTWMPQYNFDFDTFWHLVHRGMSLQQAKLFLKAFNKGVKEKLTGSASKDITSITLMQLQKALGKSQVCQQDSTSKQEIKANNDPDVTFDFQ